MKTIGVLIFLFGFFSIYVDAQQTAVLNINLYPIQIIEVNSPSITVDMDYRTVEDYKNGVNTTMQDQLKIFSNAGFAINVRSESATLTNPNSAEKINAEDITLTALPGTTNSLEGFNATPVVLSNVATQLLSSTVGGANKTVSLNYAGKGNNSYIDQQSSSKSVTTYTTQLTFSIEPT